MRVWKLFALEHDVVHRPRGTGLSAEASWFTGQVGAVRAGDTKSRTHHVANRSRTQRQGSAGACRSRPFSTNQCATGDPQEQLRETYGDVVSFQPAVPLQLDRSLLATSLRGAPSGSSPGQGFFLRDVENPFG